MDELKLLEAVGAILVPIATCFLMIPKRFGFWVLNIANIFCAYVFIEKHLWFFLGQIIILSILNFVSIHRWKKMKIGEGKES